MTTLSNASRMAPLAALFLLFALGAYFAIAAVQGEYGVLRRVQVDAEIDLLRAELDALEAEVTEMRIKTKRLSDDYLDLDLLDAQARSVLGLIRADEIIIQ